MNVLQGLKPEARVLATEDFRKGEPDRVDVSDYVTDLSLGRNIELGPLQAVVEEAMGRFEPRSSDSWLGPRVHATLRLTRREAADKRIWEYLTLGEFPHYVRWRWEKEDPDKPVPLDRFVGEDSKNAFARLWWATELTRNGSSYARSEVALGISRFSVSWLHLILIHHRPAALAVVDFLRDFQGTGATDTQGQAMAKAANVALRTVCLDALAPSPPVDADAVREWIEQKVDETTMLDELPVGPDEGRVPEEDIMAVRQLLEELAKRINLASVKPAKRAGRAELLEVSG